MRQNTGRFTMFTLPNMIRSLPKAFLPQDLITTTCYSLKNYTPMTWLAIYLAFQSLTVLESQLAHSLNIDLLIPSYSSEFPNLLDTIRLRMFNCKAKSENVCNQFVFTLLCFLSCCQSLFYRIQDLLDGWSKRSNFVHNTMSLNRTLEFLYMALGA